MANEFLAKNVAFFRHDERDLGSKMSALPLLKDSATKVGAINTIGNVHLLYALPNLLDKVETTPQ